MRIKENNIYLLLHFSLLGVLMVLCFIPVANSISVDKKEKFSIIVLPDTQYYSYDYPWIFINQTKWIVENKESLNIVFVTHLGDLVDHHRNIEEWDNANVSISGLDGNLPFGVLPGNHDGVEDGMDLTNYNTYFGFNRFNNESWYGGAYQNINTNSYQFFSAGRDDFLIFHIQFNPSDEVLMWAGEVINQHPDRRVIVSTHDFVHGYGFYSHSRSEIGEKIWDKLVKPHSDQIFLVLSGHYENEERITSLQNGHYVHQLLSDYQDRPDGGNGWLRIIQFSILTEEISVKTYSPYLNKYETDSNSQFILDNAITQRKFMFLSLLPAIILVSIITILGYCLPKIVRKIKSLTS